MKKLFSFFGDIRMESTSSQYNETLHVVLSNGRYQLLTENAIYSYGDLYSNYFNTFKSLALKDLKIDKVLLLGLGLGSIPLMLEKNFKQRYHYTAVEIDEEVIYLAHKYVLNELKSSIETICANALHYVAMAEEQFDLIAMDVFIDDKIPEEFESLDFLTQLKKCLSPNGVLLLNRLYQKDIDKEKTEHFYHHVFKKVFKEGSFLDVGGNWMLTNRDFR